MRLIRLFFAIICSFTIVHTFAQTEKLPPVIDRELFFGDPQITRANLSPDGKFISFVKEYRGTRNIWVKKAEAAFTDAKPLTEDTLRPIDNYFWSRNGKYILYVKDKGGDENFNLYAVDPNAAPAQGQAVPENKDLTHLTGIRVLIYSVPKSDPDAIFIGLNDRDKAWHDLYKLKISTGEKTLLHKNSATERITNWIFDWNDSLRLATRANEDGSHDVLKVNNNNFEKIYSTDPYEDASPYAFEKNNKRIYIVTNKGEKNNFQQLILLDPESLKEEYIERDPLNHVDISDVQFSDKTKEIIYTAYEDEKLRRYWKDKNFEKDFELIKKSFPQSEISFNSSTADENLWLLTAYSDVDPGTTYLFDRNSKKLTLQYKARPEIPVNDLAKMEPITYKSSDELTIPAYVMWPKGVAHKNLPLVIFPHGGPWYRDTWGYNSIAQFLANRGYLVLMPNFRGSTGYGKKYINAGNREWGQKMQDDITWGAKYLVSQGYVDSKKVGILGGSYGGYAALAGVAFTPDVYAAAVSIVGPSNLITLLNSIPPYWDQIRKLFYLRMGDPTTEEGKEQLKRQSPLTAADKIKTPLLVVQGANDPRVNKAESDQIVVALRDRGFPVEYIVAPDEGHGFANPINNLALFAEAEKFLAKYLGGRYQQDMKSPVEKRLKEITVDIKTVELKKK